MAAAAKAGADTQRVAIVGATSGIAQAAARVWAERKGTRAIVLIARNREALGKIADDLKVRGGAALQVEAIVAELTDPATVAEIAGRAAAAVGGVDTVLIAHGWMPEQVESQDDLVQASQVLAVTGISPALWAEAFAGQFEQAASGRIGILGSVAGDRGRKTNYIYGAAKAMLDTYANGLGHRLAASGVSVTLIKPGPTDTPMTSDLKSAGSRLAPVGAVAAQLVAAMDARTPVVYAPRVWQPIMLIIRLLPRAVFNRLSI